MKKITLLMLPLLLVCLTGCGEEKTGEISCKLSSNDVINGYKLESEYVIYYKGDVVESVKTVEVVTSESETLLETFETTLNDTYKVANDAYGGYTYEVTRENGKVTSDVVIDYNEMDFEQFVEDQPSLKSYVKNNKLKTEGLQELYETMGATCE